MPAAVLETAHFPLSNFIDIHEPAVLENFQFVSGVSDNHARELHALITLARFFPSRTVILYNLGLKQDNINMVRRTYTNIA